MDVGCCFRVFIKRAEARELHTRDRRVPGRGRPPIKYEDGRQAGAVHNVVLSGRRESIGWHGPHGPHGAAHVPGRDGN